MTPNARRNLWATTPVALLCLAVASLPACGNNGPPPEASLPDDIYLAPIDGQSVEAAATATATYEAPAGSASSDIVLSLKGNARAAPPASQSATPRTPSKKK